VRFDGDHSREARVARSVNLAHSARANERCDLIGTTRVPGVMAIGGNSTRNPCTRDAQSIRQSLQRLHHELGAFLGFTAGTPLARAG
jgi:hypothetical protein